MYVYIYIHVNNIYTYIDRYTHHISSMNPSPVDCRVPEKPQEIGPFLLNQSLKWSWHHPAGRFHTLTWGTAIDHQMKLGNDCPCEIDQLLWFFIIKLYHFLGICSMGTMGTKAKKMQLTASEIGKVRIHSSPLVLYAMIPQPIHV